MSIYSQDNNTTYCRQQRPTWHERRQHKIKHLTYAKENLEKAEAFWNNVLCTGETNILLFGHH